MRGKVLGYGNGSGVIIGDDDARYTFKAEDWCEEDEPARGQDVDFVANENAASEIYMALGARKPAVARPIDSSGLRETPSLAEAVQIGGQVREKLVESAMANSATADALTRIRAAPQIVAAAVALLASLMMTFTSIGYNDRRIDDIGFAREPIDLTLVGLPEEASQSQEIISGSLDKVEAEWDRLETFAGTAFMQSSAGIEARRKVDQIRTALGDFSRLLSASHALWLVPLVAAGVIALGWMRYAAVKPVGIFFGLLCFASVAYVVAWEKLAIGLLEAMLPKGDALIVARRAAEKAVELGAGAWVIIFCGVACIVLGVARAKSE